ncbi:MAG: hypothetical protein AVDCRST_MAG88-4689, partial [uncultured Thermomicrobiales bacterium]
TRPRPRSSSTSRTSTIARRTSWPPPTPRSRPN